MHALRTFCTRCGPVCLHTLETFLFACASDLFVCTLCGTSTRAVDLFVCTRCRHFCLHVLQTCLFALSADLLHALWTCLFAHAADIFVCTCFRPVCLHSLRTLCTRCGPVYGHSLLHSYMPDDIVVRAL